MKMLVLRVFLCILPVMAQGSISAATDDANIRETIQRYIGARNQSDEGALRNLFTPDVDQLVSTGEWRHGLEEVVRGALASSKRENGKSTVEVVSVRLLGEHVALVDGRYETATSNGAAPRRMCSAFLLERRGTGWRIAAIRNMLPAARP